MEIQYGDLSQLAWLWLVPLCLLAAAAAVWTSRRLRRRFASKNLLARLMPAAGTGRLIASTLLICLVIACLVLALIDIRWGEDWQEVPQKGIEVVFVLDVSRSMLAEDTVPNRLERAKQQIKDTVDEMAGDRVSLVVFAGEARQVIPMTSHYDDFKQGLDAVGPHSVRRGGSRLGDAIAAASKAFLTKTNDHKAMVILTDGEDQESEPLVAAQNAHVENGIRIFTIGLGDMNQGSRIPLDSQGSRQAQAYLQHEGQQVWSKLNGEILRQIADLTKGAYIPAGIKRVDMAAVYHGYIGSVAEQEFDTARINRYRPRFQIFVAIALVLLTAEILITTWPSRLTASSGWSPGSLLAESEVMISEDRHDHKGSREAA